MAKIAWKIISEFIKNYHEMHEGLYSLPAITFISMKSVYFR